MVSRHLDGVIPKRIRRIPPFLRCFTLLSRRFPSDSRGTAKRKRLTCCGQRQRTKPDAAKSRPRRPLRVTRRRPIHLFARTVSGHLEGLTLMSRGRPGFFNTRGARRSRPLRLTLSIRRQTKENRLSDFDVRAIKVLILRRKAPQPAICYFLLRGSLRHHTKFPLIRKNCPDAEVPRAKSQSLSSSSHPDGPTGFAPKATGRDHGVKTPSGVSEELSSDIPIARNQAIINSSRKIIPEFKNPWGTHPPPEIRAQFDAPSNNRRDPYSPIRHRRPFGNSSAAQRSQSANSKILPERRGDSWSAPELITGTWRKRPYRATR